MSTVASPAEYLRLLSNLPPGSRSISLGDLYIGRPGVVLPELPPEHKFIQGNHDDPKLCREQPSYLGEYGYLPDDELFFLSGALTASWRVLGNSKYWYRDEELPPEELQAAFTLYERTRPSIVISHEAPAEAAREVLNGLAGSYFTAKAETVNSRTCAVLQKMFEAHGPQKWYFGHYHLNKGFGITGTVFECLAELSVSEIPTEACSQLSSDG
jgi:hypothetical protein